MAATLVKFSLSSARVLQASAAVFIMLSVSSVDGRQCFWCGPLAEQVHRSRRAPPCTVGSKHVTKCEPGFNYCATVATSPPYVESRYCVKLYQDECYPLYCNSTKTWKMTCPCRGELCNGGNTARETEAFAVLPRLVAKTNARIQKRDASPPTLVKHKNAKIVNPNDEMPDNSLEQADGTTSNENVQAPSEIDGAVNYKEIIKNTTQADNNAAIINNIQGPATVSTKTSTDMIEIDLKKWYERDSDEIDATQKKQSQDNTNHEITKQDDSTNLHDSNPTTKGTPIVDVDNKEIKVNFTQTEMTTEAVTKHKTPESAIPTSSGVNVSSNATNKVQPSLPTPVEAFQHNESIVKKISEESKINPTKEPVAEMTTMKHASTTPVTTSGNTNNTIHTQIPKHINKNYAISISANLIIIFHSVIFNSFL